MTSLGYIFRSLLHHRFAYLGVLAGTVLGATVLLGALFAGDSVEASLRRIAEKRIGRATHVLTAGDRFFRQALAADLATTANVLTAPLVVARGTAVAPSRASANQVQLIGVTDAFWKFAPTPTSIPLNASTSTIAINDTLAGRLQVKPGDTVIVRLDRPGILVGNAPVAGAETTLQTLRCTVAAVVGDEAFGRFSLESTQVPQPSAFLPIELLQGTIERLDKANLLLIDASDRHPGREGATRRGSVTSIPSSTSDDLSRTLMRTVKLGDYGLTLKWLEVAGRFEIASDRIFIDPELAEAVTRAEPKAQPVVSYLINEFRLRDQSTPYSIATATTREAAPFLQPDLGVQEIVLNEWLAEDLNASTGDQVQLTFFQAGVGDSLVEKSASFRVRSIVPLQGLAGDRAWMPDFPGMSDAARTSEWDPGLPLNLERIRPKDESYWDQHRGAPKAFMSLEAGRAHFSSRWGNYTALRIATDRSREAELVEQLLAALRPEMNQLLVRDLRRSAESSAQSPVDFGGLFIGMSSFLIIAALGLVAMLFQLSLLQRNREDALLGAVGVAAGKLLRWRLAEGFVILLVGGALGLGLATLYTRGILRFLESIWAAQSASPTFAFAAHPASIATGACAFVILSLAAIGLAIRRQTRRTLSIRLAAHMEDTSSPEKVIRRSRWLAFASAAVAAAAVGVSGRALPAQGAFYLAGFALLVSGTALCRSWMAQAGTSRDADLDASRLGVLNLKTRRARSLTVVGLIATAVFMVLSVASFRKHVGRDWLKRDSGTGGFAFWVETTAPQNISRDGKSAGFEVFERHTAELGNIVPLRAGVGDNANCFNLNSTSQPRLLAVDSEKFAALNAFAPRTASSNTTSRGWNMLRTTSPGRIPAFVDATTLQWALKRKVGDTLSYADENGRTFDVEIVGTLPDSVFQGYVIVDEQLFLQRYPSSPGYSVFLIEARTPGGIEAMRNQLEAPLRDVGGRVDITRDVLAAFHEIENTYIAIFNVLGSLGVILGSLGLAIVVARNLRERRGEFAVMSAIGIPRGVLGRMVFAEFGRLVLWGIAIGGFASAIAVWPNITTLPAFSTILLVTALLVGIVALNLVCGWAIFRWSLRDLHPSIVQTAS
jgi:putative ABC transport system permease protein